MAKKKRSLEEDEAEKCEESNKKMKCDSEEDPHQELNIKKFRDGLRKGNFFDDLKLFIKKAAKSPEIISKLIKSGGNPLEIVDIIKTNENSSLDIISNLYEMLKMVILQVMEDEQDEGKSKIVLADALKYLVRKNSSSLNLMLESSNLKDKIVIFELLTIGVSLDREIGREILKNLPLFTKPDESNVISQIRSTRRDGKKLENDYKTIRTSYVRLIFTFINNEEDVILVKRIAQKTQLFDFFLEDLHNESSETIIKIISTLQSTILYSSAFSKPDKLKIFSDNGVKSLLKIYEWKSHDTKERESVIKCVHEFLTTLLASKKYGIASKALSEQKQNLRQSHVISQLKNIWMYEYPSKLVIQIIKSCPDLMQNLLIRFVYGLQPSVTVNWFMCANFVKSLLNALDPAVMIKYFSMLEAKKISSNIIKLSISQYILQNIGTTALIDHDSLEMREIATQILEVMLIKCCQYIRLLQSETQLKDFELHRVKFDVINHIFTFYPHIDVILNSLYRSINSTNGKTVEGRKLVKSQLKNTLNILLLIVDHFPSVIEKIPSVIDFLDVLRPIYEYQESDFNQDELEIGMKVAKIILYLKPEILSSKPELFSKIFHLLLQVYIYDVNQSHHARKLIISILQQSYKIQTLEVIVWLEAFRVEKKEILKNSTSLFVKVLQQTDNEESEGISPILSRILAMNENKINKISEFVEKAILLFNFAFPEKRKMIGKMLKSSKGNFNAWIFTSLKSSTDNFESILEILSFSPFNKMQNTILNNILYESDKENQDTSFLLVIQIIFNALRLFKNDELSDEKIENLTEIIRKLFEEIKKVDEKFPDEVIEREENLEGENIMNKIFSYKLTPTSQLLTSYIFEDHIMLLNAFSVNSTDQINKFIDKLIDVFKDIQCFDKSSHKYRSKIVEEFKEDQNAENPSIMKFPYDDDDCLKIIETFTNNKVDLELFSYILQRLSTVKGKGLELNHMNILEAAYLNAYETENEKLTIFELAILEYIKVFPHNIEDFSSKIFEVACKLQNPINRKSFVPLIQLIFRSKSEFDSIFKKEYKNMRKEIAFPLFAIAIDRGSISSEELKGIFLKEFKTPILKAIERPKKTAAIYREFIETTLKFIDIGMSANECSDLSMKKFKFEGSEVFQLKILREVFQKAFESKLKEEEKVFSNFINHWLKLFEQTTSDFTDYTSIINEWLKNSNEFKVEISDEENFQKVFKFCLKNGLSDKENSILLQVVGKILAISSIESTIVINMFDLLLTHSNFYSVAFSAKSSNWKRDLFFLFNALVQKNPKIASEKHIPILLSSYNATMSSCDRLILKLLQFYELHCNVDLHDYRPLMFGVTALNYYSSSNGDKEITTNKKTLDSIEVTCHKLIESFENSIIENTVNNFPINRKLNVKEEDFFNDDEKLTKIYDPAFYLPVFEMVLSTTTFSFTSQSIKSNLLQLVPLALSSEDENLRLLAANILMKCRQQTESKKMQKEIWLKFYECIQKGLFELKETSKSFPRAPSIITRMLSEFIKVLSNKLHPAHHQICNYLIVKEKIDFSTIPEYLILFQSNLTENEDHRQLLLNVIVNGIKDGLDCKVLNNTPMLKVILSCYGSPLSSRKTDLMIMKIFDRLITTDDGLKFMLEKFGFALFLFQISTSVEGFEFDTIEMLITIINNLRRVGEDNSRILTLSLLKLLPKITKSKISPKSFSSFLSAINKLGHIAIINKENIGIILEIAERHLSIDQMQTLKYLSKYPKTVEHFKNQIAKSELYEEKIMKEIKELFCKMNQI